MYGIVDGSLTLVFEVNIATFFSKVEIASGLVDPFEPMNFINAYKIQ